MNNQINKLYEYWQNLAPGKKKLIQRSFLIVSALVVILFALVTAYNSDNKNIMSSYAHDSAKSSIKAKKLKFKPQVYSSDIDNVHMITPYELQNYRQTALKRGYGDNYAGYVSVPQIGLYLPILNGVNMYTLALGAAAYYPNEVQIGGAGNYVLAGHNMNTSLNVLFSRVPNIRVAKNSIIVLTDKKKNYYYHVTDKKLVRPYQPVIRGTITPTKKSVLYSDKNKKQVTLFTCNYNGTRRWVIVGQYDYEQHLKHIT